MQAADAAQRLVLRCTSAAAQAKKRKNIKQMSVFIASINPEAHHGAPARGIAAQSCLIIKLLHVNDVFHSFLLSTFLPEAAKK